MPLISAQHSEELNEALIQWEGLKKIDSQYKCALCEGDSWFSIGGFTSSILLDLQELNEKYYEDKLLLVNCSYPGDTLQNIHQVFTDPLFKSMLNPKLGTKWDAILMSVGGNDLIEKLQQGVAESNAEELKAYYRKFFATIAETQNCPIYTHGYSMPQLRYRKLFWKLGPWIGPAMDRIEPDRSLHSTIFYFLLKDLHAGLRNLEFEYPNFHVIYPNINYLSVTKWQNEIHPKRGKGGYMNIADCFFVRLTR